MGVFNQTSIRENLNIYDNERMINQRYYSGLRNSVDYLVINTRVNDNYYFLKILNLISCLKKQLYVHMLNGEYIY